MGETPLLSPSRFDSELAGAAVRDYSVLVEQRVDPVTASQRVISRLAPADDDVNFWVALGVAQSRHGMLQPDVRDRAVALIEADGDIASYAARSRR